MFYVEAGVSSIAVVTALPKRPSIRIRRAMPAAEPARGLAPANAPAGWAYREALRLDPNEAEVHLALGNLLRSSDRQAEADTIRRDVVLCIEPADGRLDERVLLLLVGGLTEDLFMFHDIAGRQDDRK